MIIKSLSLRGFRNLIDCDIDTSYKQVILKGENGQGKTNLLESFISYVTDLHLELKI